MNPNSHFKSAFRWVLFSLASMLAAATAFGQLSVRNQGGGTTINDNGPATPYPSTNLVQGTIGVLEKVTVTLNGITHGYPDDIDMLLQGPDGTTSILMSDAGGQFDLNGITFTLDSSSVILPDEAQITDGGVYKPADYDAAGDTDALPDGTELSTADLTVFNGKTGSQVNGKWNLYVRDDNVIDSGALGSWTLNLYLSPTLSITNALPISVSEDAPATINVFVNDADTPLPNVTLSATSSDTSIIPNSGLTFGGNTGGTNRTLTITAASNANGGPVTITVVAKDAQGNVIPGVNQQTITVNVAAVNDAPALVLGGTSVSIPQAGISAPINVRVTDVDNPATDLVLTATSSNPGVISATNVLFSRLASPSGTTAGTNRTVQIAAAGATGTATLTIIVTDPSGGASSNTITATVTAATGLVGANTTAIQVPDSGAATPNPSNITIPNPTGLGLVGKAVVNLINVEHANPADLAVLLVAPSGRSVVLMRGAGDSIPVGIGDTNDIRLTFDRDAASSISGTELTTSTNRPSDLGTDAGEDFPGAPAGPYSTDLDSLRGSAANGVWSLYVYDTTTGNAAGQIAGGWTLQIIPAPTIASIPDQTTPEDTSKTITFQVGDFAGSVTNIGARVVNSADASKVSLSTSLSGTTGSLTLTPAPNFNSGVTGTTIPIMVVVTNNTGGTVATAGFTATNIFNLVVTPVNDAPTQSVIPKQITRAGQSVGPVNFTVGDVETTPANLTVTATSDNPKLLPAGAVILGTDTSDASGATRTIQMFPTGAQGGTANITVTVTDTGDGVNPPTSSSQTFTLTVNAASNPLFENTTGIAINDNGTASPYPSIVNVSGLQGSVAEVQVTLYGITHPNPDDLDIMLVGPGTAPAAVVLMSDVGDSGDGSKPLNNVTLRFRQSAGTSLPDENQIVSGDYLPTDIGGGDFPISSSPAATSATLAAFNNSNPNGDWKLYVVDDTVSIRGGVISSWQLSIRTHPVLAAIPDQTVTEHNNLRLTASLGDDQPGVAYTVTTSHSAVAGSTDVIDTITPANGSTVFGSSQTFTITPIAEIGSSRQTNQVTLTFTDPDGVSVSRTFNVVFIPVDDAPTFGTISDKTTATATPITVNFTVQDPEGTAVTVTATSSRQDIVSDADLAAAINPNGTTTSARTLTIVPNGIASGSTTISLSAVDATGQKSTKSFVLNVSPNVAFASRGQITINDLAPATPYPSTIDVSGVNGTVSGASVVLVGFSHVFPDDVDVLLVAPDGRSVMLMSDAGGDKAVSNARITFATGGPVIPDQTQITSGSYSPANYSDIDVDEMPSPAPAAPTGGYSVDLTSLQGVNPNGQWKLYVRDDYFPDGGVISGGWILLLQTAPTISQIPAQTTREDTVLRVPFTVFDQDTPVSGLTVSASVDDSKAADLISLANVTWVTNSATPPTVEYTLNILPSTNRPAGTQPETNTVTVTVTDGTKTASTSFEVRVVPVDDAPTIAGAFVPSASFIYATNHVVTVQATTTPATTHPITLRFDVRDIDSTIGTSSNIVVESLNPTLLPNKPENIAVSGPDNQAPNTQFPVSVTLTPAVNQSGSAIVNFIVSDRTQRVTNQVTLEVIPTNNVPVIVFSGMNATTPETNVIAGGTISNIPIIVSDIETAPEDLILTVSSRPEDQGLVPNSGLILGGRGANRTLSLSTVGTATGDAEISVVAQDAAGDKTTKKFTVHVTPPPGSVFSNGGALSVPGTGTAGVASSYPSVLSVSGMVGSVSKVTVTIDGLTHTAPDDIDILLVSPGGNKAILMSDAGGRNPVSNVRLVFDQNGGVLPDESQITTGTYRPLDYEPGVDTFASPAPAGPYIASLQQFVGASPNGNWSLYIVDDATGDAGQIAFGWSLRIETAPTVTLNSGLNTPSGSPTYLQFTEDTTSTIQFTINDMVTAPNNLAVGFTSSDAGLIQSIVTNWVSVSGNAAVINATITPTTNAFGTNNLTIVVRRSDGAQSTLTVPMNITPADDAPFISRLVDRTTQADTALNIPVLITDVDTPLSRVWVIATSGNQSVISSTNILVAGVTNQLRGLVPNGTSLVAFPPGNPDTYTNLITIVPNTAAFSSSPVPINIEVREVDANGNTIQSTIAAFNVTVTPVNHRPSITGVGGNPIPSVIAVEAGQTTTNILFTVADPDNDNLTITATSSDQTLVRDADIIIYNSDNATVINGVSVAPGQRAIRVTTQPGVQGSAVITVTVKDPGNATTTAEFIVRVVPTRELVFSNNRPITIRDNNSADPYPSQINVSGFAGAVSKVTVTLNGFQHTFPSDVDIVLVSPAGKKAYIMSDAGGGPNAGTFNLRFDDTDSVAVAVPVETTLASTTYKVANYDGTSNDDFFNRSPSGPAGPFAAALSTFNGDSPNGAWSLYVVDDQASDSGAITNGWSLGITTLPVLAGLSDVTSQEDVAVRLPFTIAEESFVNTGNYSFTATSTNPALVPSANVVVSGTGTNRTVTVTPNANANDVNAGGPTLITLTEQTTGVSASFHVSFTPANDVPQITPVSDISMAQGSFAVIHNFTYTDVETAKKDLIVSVSSSDPTVIPVQNVVIAGTDIRVFSGTTPGTSRITITVSDSGDGSNPATTSTASFNVTVTAGGANTTVFANNSGITINDNSRATPYPSSINVSNVNGTVRTVTVSITGLTHPYPDDVDILLVGPNGQGVVVMSDAGAGGPGAALNNAFLVISDDATDSIPDNSPIQPFSLYKPTNYEVNNDNAEFASPAPAGPYAATFAGAFGNLNPNGTWSLYVQDDASPDAGSITGWSLSFDLNEVGPTLTGLVDTNALEDTIVQIPFTVGGTPSVDTVTFATSYANSNLVSAVKVGGSGADRLLQITLVPNATGSSQISVQATDANGTRTREFVLTVAPVNDAPVIGSIANQTIMEGSTLVRRLEVSDTDTPIADLRFFAATDTNNIVSDITFDNNGTTVTMTITPVPGANGTDRITLSVSDGANVTRTSFNVTVVPQNAAPVFGSIPNQTVAEDSVVTIPLSVSDLETAVSNLTFSAITSNAELVQSITFDKSGANPVATLHLAPTKFGNAAITITVSDGVTPVSQSFTLTVIDVPHPPVLDPIPNQTVALGSPLRVILHVTDADDAIGDLTFFGSPSDTNIIRNIVFAPDTANTVLASIELIPGATGSDTVTISVSDGGQVSRQHFTVTVTSGGAAPTLSVSKSGNNLNITVTGTSGATYVIEGATDVAGPYTQVGTVTISSSGSAVVPVPITGAHRFFRARVQ